MDKDPKNSQKDTQASSEWDELSEYVVGAGFVSPEEWQHRKEQAELAKKRFNQQKKDPSINPTPSGGESGSPKTAEVTNRQTIKQEK